ncbi:MAG TPA: dipeptidase [Xanthobacteraceae bacterium]|nr:dipeptidase [Xanthobacteraceae bacterium]
MAGTIAVFDGHNDVLLRLHRSADADPVRSFLDGTDAGQLDLPRARQGGFACGLFAVFAPSPRRVDKRRETDAVPLPPPLPISDAQASTLAMIAIILRIERASQGHVEVCRDAAQIRDAMSRGALAVVLHLEGAEAIDPDFHMLDVLYAAGLRSLGPVWSRPNIWGHGVPFRFPGSPDAGPGLTDAGQALVRACNQRRILIDLSHLTEQGFWDVVRLSQAPLVATHSNVHAISASPRNLTDRQLDAIRDADGLVGLNFATSMLRGDGQMRADTDLEWMVRHVDALIRHLGESRVALGSDFDGAVVPSQIGSVAGLQALFEALRRHGFGEPMLHRLGTGNWLDLLERTIG